MSIIYCERILKNSLRLLCVLCTIYMVSCDTNDIEDTNQQSRRKNIQVRIVGPGTTDSIVECLQGIPFASYDELLSYSGEDGTDCYGTQSPIQRRRQAGPKDKEHQDARPGGM